MTGFYQPPQFGSNKPKFTGEVAGAPPPPSDDLRISAVGDIRISAVGDQRIWQ